MLMSRLACLILIGFPVSTFAQFIDKGDFVEVKKGTKLCSNVEREREKGVSISRSGILDRHKQHAIESYADSGIFNAGNSL